MRAAVVAAARETFGRVTHLVNNAGGAGPNDPLRMSPEAFEEVFRFNVTSAYALSQLCVPLMREAGGGTPRCAPSQPWFFLTAGLTVVLAIVAVQRAEKARAIAFLITTLVLGVVFLVIKSFEWGAKFHHGLYPNSPHLATLPPGEQVFYGLYFTMTGLHGVHVIAGLSVLGVMLWWVATDRIRADRYVHLENSGLYWHLVDVIWIFLLPLFYLAA